MPGNPAMCVGLPHRDVVTFTDVVDQCECCLLLSGHQGIGVVVACMFDMFNGDGHEVGVQVGGPPGIMFPGWGVGHTAICIGCIRFLHALGHESAPAHDIIG